MPRIPPPETPTRREREIMNVLFLLGNRATAEDIQQHLNPPSYSAVRAMLVRLETKGHIHHQQPGARYLYSATTSPAAARRAALQQHLRVFFGGSLGHMMMTVLRQESWTDDELNQLQAEIDQIRKDKKP